MKFRLIPKEEKFFDLFERAAGNVVKGAKLLNEILMDISEIDAKAKRLKEIEHDGDSITHEIIKKLNTTFITPIDREDIYSLSGRIDDVLDLIEGASDRLMLYKVQKPREGAKIMADILLRAAEEMQSAVFCLRDLNKDYFKHCVETNRLENEADRVYKHLIAGLFDECVPIEVIKWKEIYETLENATDRCEDVVNIIESVILKNA